MRCMTAESRLRSLEAALHGRSLVYFGTRGSDAEPFLRLQNFASLFSLIAPLDASSVSEISLERETGARVELDSYNLDLDPRPIIGDLRRRLLQLFDRPSAVIPYRPCAFLSSAWFPRSDRVLYLGLFHEAQACFEHKPWVESQLARAGVRVLPWHYWADSDRPLLREWAARQPLVLRANRTDGGLGVQLLNCPTALETQWPPHNDGFLAAAPYLNTAIPLNVNACVFADGSVTMHGPSLQIIGVPTLTRRTFGYCGNDFGAISELDDVILDDFETMTRHTALWLHEKGYRGAFGIDALLFEGRLYLTEINPRFQGSSRLSARLDAELDRADVFLEHTAAMLGMTPPPPTPLRELARSQGPWAHMILHNLFDEPVSVAPTSDSVGREYRLEPDTTTNVLPEAVAFEVVVEQAVTRDGKSLIPAADAIVHSMVKRLWRASAESAQSPKAEGTSAHASTGGVAMP